MKISKLKTNDKFKTDTGVVFQILAMTAYEKRTHPDRYKCKRLDTNEIFFLTDNILIRKA